MGSVQLCLGSRQLGLGQLPGRQGIVTLPLADGVVGKQGPRALPVARGATQVGPGFFDPRFGAIQSNRKRLRINVKQHIACVDALTLYVGPLEQNATYPRTHFDFTHTRGAPGVLVNHRNCSGHHLDGGDRNGALQVPLLHLRVFRPGTASQPCCDENQPPAPARQRGLNVKELHGRS